MNNQNHIYMDKINLKTALSIVGAAMMFSSCSDEPEQSTVFRRVIDFETASVVTAGPTSYGDNLYATYTGTKFTEGRIEVENGVYLHFGINYSDYAGAPDFSAGGMVLSKWNIRTDLPGKDAGWWFTYENQCSVYNTASTDGANKGAGAGGSNTFAVIKGYDGAYISSPSFDFTDGKEYNVESVEICPTSYLYGVITKGNPFGIDQGMSLEQAKGWFKIEAYGFDAQGAPTNGGRPAEMYVCDYRDSAKPAIAISSEWRTWDLRALGKVNKVSFNFTGSDTGAYGLNTPAYMCLDNLTLRLSE